MIEASSVVLNDKLVLKKIAPDMFNNMKEVEVIRAKDIHKVVKKLQTETGWDKNICIQRVVAAVTELAGELGLGREYITYYLPMFYREDTEQVQAQIFKHRTLKSLAPALSNIYFKDNDKLNNVINFTVAMQNLTLTHPKSLNWFSTFETYLSLVTASMHLRGTDRYLPEVKSELIQIGTTNADAVILRALVDLNVKSFMGDSKLHMFTIIRRVLGEQEYLRLTSEFAYVWEKSYEEFLESDYPTLIEKIQSATKNEHTSPYCRYVLGRIKTYSK